MSKQRPSTKDLYRESGGERLMTAVNDFSMTTAAQPLKQSKGWGRPQALTLGVTTHLENLNFLMHSSFVQVSIIIF